MKTQIVSFDHWLTLLFLLSSLLLDAVQGEIDHDNFHTYLQADLPMFWFFTNNARPEATWENFQKVLTPFAEKYRGRVAFVGGHNYLSHTQKMHLSGIQYVVVFVVVVVVVVH